MGRESFERSVKREFRAQGIEPVLDKYYLDCTSGQQDAAEHIRKYLDIVESRSADLILVVGDQASSSLLSTRHGLLDTVPVVACNVHFPDEKLINDCGSRKVYVLRDLPDFQRNMEFIKSLQPRTGMEIVYNIDLTPLGMPPSTCFRGASTARTFRYWGINRRFPRSANTRKCGR